MSVAEQVAQEHLQASEGLEDAIASLKSSGFDDLYTPFGKVATDAVVSVLRSWKPKAIPASADVITVYHSTDRATADRLLQDGVIPQIKPSNLAMERYEAGEYAEFAPGRGVSRGIYVGSDPRGTSGYGAVTLELEVPQRWLQVSPEQAALGEKDPMRALRTEDGAVIMHAVPPDAIREVKTRNGAMRKSNGFTPPNTINVLDRHGGFTIESKPPMVRWRPGIQDARERYKQQGRWDIASREDKGRLHMGDSLWRPGSLLKKSTQGDLLAWDDKSFYQTNNDVTLAVYRVPGYGYPVMVWFDNATGKRIA